MVYHMAGRAGDAGHKQGLAAVGLACVAPAFVSLAFVSLALSSFACTHTPPSEDVHSKDTRACTRKHTHTRAYTCTLGGADAVPPDGISAGRLRRADHGAQARGQDVGCPRAPAPLLPYAGLSPPPRARLCAIRSATSPSTGSAACLVPAARLPPLAGTRVSAPACWRVCVCGMILAASSGPQGQ